MPPPPPATALDITMTVSNATHRPPPLFFSPLLILLLIGLTACDLASVQEEVEDFNIVVELPKIRTVANVQVMDINTRQPVAQDLTLTVDGPDAGSVIDAYSAPITEARVRGGFAAIGLDNARVPSPTDPVRLQLRATAEGYLPASRIVAIDDTGSVAIRLLMVPETPRQAPEGTQGTRTSIPVRKGMVAKPVAVTVNGQPGASVSATLAPETRLLDGNGQPLDGDLSLDLMSYDINESGLRALPDDVRETVSGGTLVSVTRLRVTDGKGRLAAQFQRTAKTGTGLSLNLTTGTVTAAMEATHYILRLQSGTDVVDVYVPTELVSGGSLSLGISGDQLIVNGVAHDISTLASQTGDLYISLQGVSPTTCLPGGTIQIDPNGHTGTVTLAASGNGLFYEKQVSVTSGQTTTVNMSTLVLDLTVPDLGTDWPITALAPNGDVTTTSANVCGSGTTPLTLPSASASLIDVTVAVDPGCPAGQDIAFVGNVDGYVLNVRKAGTTIDFQPVPGGNVVIHSTDTSFEGMDVALNNVEPSQDYEFYAAFDGNSGSKIITMPSTNGGITTVTDNELSKHCQ
jgi:hypothetical protein